eukprot:1746040-Rhodomonas_salina.1
MQSFSTPVPRPRPWPGMVPPSPKSKQDTSELTRRNSSSSDSNNVHLGLSLPPPAVMPHHAPHPQHHCRPPPDPRASVTVDIMMARAPAKAAQLLPVMSPTLLGQRRRERGPAGSAIASMMGCSCCRRSDGWIGVWWCRGVTLGGRGATEHALDSMDASPMHFPPVDAHHQIPRQHLLLLSLVNLAQCCLNSSFPGLRHLLASNSPPPMRHSSGRAQQNRKN